VVVGGGISGLAALSSLRGDGWQNVPGLDNHPMFGEKRSARVRSGWKRLMVHQGSAHASRRTPDYLAGSIIQSVSIGSSSDINMDGVGEGPEIQTAPYGVGGPTLGF